MEKIKIALDFTPSTGGRTQDEGPNSGELFRETILLPKYRKCVENNDMLEVDFDDCYGIGTSFLEEAFGGLVRVHGYRGVLQRLRMIATEDLTIFDNVKKYITEAEEKLSEK